MTTIISQVMLLLLKLSWNLKFKKNKPSFYLFKATFKRVSPLHCHHSAICSHIRIFSFLIKERNEGGGETIFTMPSHKPPVSDLTMNVMCEYDAH